MVIAAGSQDFIDWVKIIYRDLKGSDEMPQIKELYPDFEIIIPACVISTILNAKNFFI